MRIWFFILLSPAVYFIGLLIGAYIFRDVHSDKNSKEYKQEKVVVGFIILSLLCALWAFYFI